MSKRKRSNKSQSQESSEFSINCAVLKFSISQISTKKVRDININAQ